MQATTLSIDKDIHRKAAEKARNQRLSVSAVARMLLEAYGNGQIHIRAIANEELPVQLIEVSESEITPAMRKAAEQAYQLKREQLINI